MVFGRALEFAKDGRLIARKGWNGKGMFVFMRPEDELDTHTIITKVKSLPQSVKNYFLEKENNDLPEEQGLTKVKFTAYLCMKASDGTIVNGWLASQADMLADDWEVLKD